MRKEARPQELRDFTDPKTAEKILKRSPEVQQEVLLFLLSFKEICTKYEDTEALEALETLQSYFLEKYPDCLKAQPVFDEQRNISEYVPSPELMLAVNEKRGINVPEGLLVHNKEIQQAGLEFLLCFWKIYDDYQEDDISKALSVVIEHYIKRYPSSFESQSTTHDSSLNDRKIEILTQILGHDLLDSMLGVKQ